MKGGYTAIQSWLELCTFLVNCFRGKLGRRIFRGVGLRAGVAQASGREDDRRLQRERGAFDATSKKCCLGRGVKGLLELGQSANFKRGWGGLLLDRRRKRKSPLYGLPWGPVKRSGSQSRTKIYLPGKKGQHHEFQELEVSNVSVESHDNGHPGRGASDS